MSLFHSISSLTDKPVLLIGYGGHGFVAADILIQNGYTIAGYCEKEAKERNPYDLSYMGDETSFFSNQENIDSHSAFISIGNSELRKKVFSFLNSLNANIINAIHVNSNVARNITIGKGVLIAANASINPCCTIGNGVICNTSSSIDHECSIGDFSHICPGTVLCGNVTVGKHSFIGANSTIIPGKKICDNIYVGAGSTVIHDLLEPGIYAGTPAVLLKR